jgi:hypothetical protein
VGIALQGWLGEGEGAAYGLFFVAIGIYTVILGLASWAYGPLRNLERDIPDADELPEVASGNPTSVVGAEAIGDAPVG